MGGRAFNMELDRTHVSVLFHWSCRSSAHGLPFSDVTRTFFVSTQLDL